MKTQKLISMLTFAIIALITVSVIYSTVYEGVRYSSALDNLNAGNLCEARAELESVKYGYRDREVLLDYIDIMQNYDPADSSNVYRSYRTLSKLISNVNSDTVSGWIEASRQAISMSYYSLLGQTNGLG